MHYLIDGHNLIARVPGLSLADPDDEVKLLQLLKIGANEISSKFAASSSLFVCIGRGARSDAGGV